MMKIFSRFHTAEEHEQLVQGLIREKMLKQKIEEYRELRDRGFKTRQEVEAELERKLEAKSKKKAASIEYSFLKAQYEQPRGVNDPSIIESSQSKHLQRRQPCGKQI